jgi:hypothetical protein
VKQVGGGAEGSEVGSEDGCEDAVSRSACEVILLTYKIIGCEFNHKSVIVRWRCDGDAPEGSTQTGDTLVGAVAGLSTSVRLRNEGTTLRAAGR